MNIFIADQSDREMWQRFRKQMRRDKIYFDVILDDGECGVWILALTHLCSADAVTKDGRGSETLLLDAGRWHSGMSKCPSKTARQRLPGQHVATLSVSASSMRMQADPKSPAFLRAGGHKVNQQVRPLHCASRFCSALA